MARKQKDQAAGMGGIPVALGDAATLVGDGSGGALDPISDPVEEMVSAVLLKPHEHQDRQCQPGEQINLRPPIADWLRSLGVID